MMWNRVQSYSHKVASVILRSYIRKHEGIADQMFSCEMVSSVNVLSSRTVDWVVSTVDAGGIIRDDRYMDSITESCACIEVPDCVTQCRGKSTIFCFYCRTANILLFLRGPGYSTTM